MSNEKTIAPSLKSVINDSLERANKSLKTLTKTEFELQVERIEPLTSIDQLNIEKGPFNFVVTTELIGCLKGHSYLYMEDQASERLYKLVMERMKNTNIEKVAVLKEIDNILSASAISVFGNYTNEKVYGDVPYYFDYSNEKIFSIMKEEFTRLQEEESSIVVYAHYKCPDQSQDIKFHWIISGLK